MVATHFVTSDGFGCADPLADLRSPSTSYAGPPPPSFARGAELRAAQSPRLCSGAHEKKGPGRWAGQAPT